MLKGDIDLTQNLDFHHDTSERNNLPAKRVPWKDDEVFKWKSGNFRISSNSTTYINYTGSYNITTHWNNVDSYDFLYDNIYEDTIQYYTYSIDNNATSVHITSNGQNILYSLDNNNSSSTTATISYKYSKERKKNCFGYYDKEFENLFYSIDQNTLFKNKCKKRKRRRYIQIPWIVDRYYDDLDYYCPWDKKENKQKRITRDKRIPWLQKLNSWIKSDYLDELRLGKKDYSNYLTSTWFRPSHNKII